MKFAALQGSEIEFIAFFQKFKFLNLLECNLTLFLANIFGDKLTHQGQ